MVSSHIDGSIGLLGDDYPGYFPAGDTAELARLLRRAEEEASFLAELDRAASARRFLVEPEREREAWQRLLEELDCVR